MEARSRPVPKDYAPQGRRYALVGATLAALVLLLVGFGVVKAVKSAERERIQRIADSLAGGPRNYEEAETFMLRARLLGSYGPKAAPAAPAVANLLRYVTTIDYTIEITDILVQIGDASIAPLIEQLRNAPTHEAGSVIRDGNFNVTCIALARFPNSTERLIALLERDPESQAGRNAAYALALQARGLDLVFSGDRLLVTPVPAAAAALEDYVDFEDEDLASAAYYAIESE